MTKVRNIKPADENHQVVTVEGGKGSWRKTPCSDCPWRVDATGTFPAEAFRHSANTAYDMSSHKFGCHQSGTQKPATCAGFLLRGADHNMAVRMERMQGNMLVEEPDVALHHDYVDMAVANGVDETDPILTPCRRTPKRTRS